MTKLTLLTLVLCTAAVAFFNIAASLDENRPQRDPEGVDFDVLEDDDDLDRAGASARASASASASARPNVGLVNKPKPPGNGQGPQPNIGPRVECYVCTDCPKVFANTTTKLCPYTSDRSKQKTCVAYAEQYRHLKRPWYIRGCASERGTCLDIKQAHASHSNIVQINFCNECQGDRCNTSGAAISILDFSMAFFALVVTPIVAKYTLS